MRSIRTRLILGTASATILLLAVCGVGIYVSVRASLLKELDGSLGTKARALASMTEQKASTIKMEFDSTQIPEFGNRKRPEYFQLRAQDGAILARSASLGEQDLGEPSRLLRPEFIRLPDGRPGRALAFVFRPRLEDAEETTGTSSLQSATIIVARDTQEFDRTLARIGWLLALVCGAATIVSAALMTWIIRRALRPMGTLAAHIARVGDANLADRIDTRGIPIELEPVVQRLNELLARLDAAFLREKSFSADVAHELRTPLAGLQATLEVCGSRQRTPDEYQRTWARCLDATHRLRAMVDNLLILARAESQQFKVTSEPVPIEALLSECWTPLRNRAAQRGISLKWEVDGSCILQTDREKLRLVLHNLLENAASYTNANGSIATSAGMSDGNCVVRIANTGSHVSAEDAARVFERFWRGDAARTDTGVHCGLGLTLCKRMVEGLGGAIAVRSHAGGEFSVEIVLPHATPIRTSDEAYAAVNTGCQPAS